MEYKAVYERIGHMAPLYDAFLAISGYRDGVRRFVQELHKQTGNDVTEILDAGCGTGMYTVAALKEFPHAHVTAFDLQEELVRRTRMNAQRAGVADRLHTFVGDITQPLDQLQDRTFDAAILSGVLEHVDPKVALPIVGPHIKEGGTILHSPVADHGIKRKILERIYGFRARSTKEHTHAFASQGFDLMSSVRLPWAHPASFKEAFYFRKTDTGTAVTASQSRATETSVY